MNETVTLSENLLAVLVGLPTFLGSMAWFHEKKRDDGYHWADPFVFIFGMLALGFLVAGFGTAFYLGVTK